MSDCSTPISGPYLKRERRQSRAKSGHRVSVPMLMVHVERMRMRMFEPAVLMGMSMRLSRAIFDSVLMLVMLVMHVRMRVRHGLVGMGMFVAFR
jgi:hypothetical protein